MTSPSNQIYLVLKYRNGERNDVEIQGVFTTEAAAKEACRTWEDIYMPLELNKEYSQEREVTQSLYCPKQNLWLAPEGLTWEPISNK